jgi:uncharacterized protein YdaU (DUF1376 family)
MTKSPAFQFYVNDWLSSPSISMMTPCHEGAYIRLLCYDWASDGIPDDDDALAMLSRLGEGWFKGGSAVVRKCFNQHPTKSGFLTNIRLQKEREKQRIWREKSSMGGKKSGQTRAKQQSKSKGGSTKAQPTGQPNSNSSSSSSSLFNTPIVPKGTVEEKFTEFWSGVPNKIARGAAARAFAKACKKVSPDEIIAGLPGFIAYESQRSKQPDYRALHPATWLNGERWADAPTQKPKASKNLNGYSTTFL